MLRVRFYIKAISSLPETKHPIWCTGHSRIDDMVIETYADCLEDVARDWPSAHGITFQAVSGYEFTDRFPRPEGF